MGGGSSKALVDLAGRPLLEHVLARFTPETDPILISANDPEAFASFGLGVVRDLRPGFAGPLAGLEAAAAELAAGRTGITHVLALPADTPFLPRDLGQTMGAHAGTRIRVARYDGRLQPTVALWPMSALATLPGHLATARNLSILGFLEAATFEAVDFPVDAWTSSVDPFFNVNTPADLALARAAMVNG